VNLTNERTKQNKTKNGTKTTIELDCVDVDELSPAAVVDDNDDDDDNDVIDVFVSFATSLVGGKSDDGVIVRDNVVVVASQTPKVDESTCTLHQLC
jgi:hypothetical protein